MHQGWPKFTKNALMVDEDNVYAMVYMPVEADIEIDSKKVTILSETQYPFKGDVKFTLKMDEAAEFKFNLRIPKWCKNYSISINNEKIKAAQSGNMAVLDRTFMDGDEVLISFEMPVVVNKGWYNNSASVERGPLVFGLNLKESWKKLDKGIEEYPYYEIYPETPWNYAINPQAEIAAEVNEITSKQAFSHDYSPVRLRAKALRVPSWELEKNSAGELPQSPVTETADEETIELIPYGCAKLRVSLFPWVE